MKKVSLIGKKVMSLGLAASLLMAPVSVNICSAASVKETVKTGAKYTAGITVAVAAVALMYFYGPKAIEFCQDNKEVAKAIIDDTKIMAKFGVRTVEDLFKFLKCLAADAFDLGDCIYSILDKIGFKNILATIGTGYVAKKTYDIGKFVCNKVKNWFKGDSNKKNNGVKNFDMRLVIKV